MSDPGIVFVAIAAAAALGFALGVLTVCIVVSGDERRGTLVSSMPTEPPAVKLPPPRRL